MVNKLGFTLIETIIYIALTSLLIGGMLTGAYELIRSSDILERKMNADAEAHFLEMKLEWAFSNSAGVVLPVEGSSGTVLSVNKINFIENPIVIDLDLGNIRLRRALGEPAVLNSENVTVTDLRFDHLSSVGGQPPAIKVSFKINMTPFEMIRYLR